MAQITTLTDMKERAHLYLLLMDEAAMRFDVIDGLMTKLQGVHPGIVREMCFLQIRCLCELVALGCVAARGNLSEARALKKSYEPGKIFKQLGALNRHFFPEPVSFEDTETGMKIRGDKDAAKVCLKKDELPKLWAQAGDNLHRAPMAKMLKPTRQDADFSMIEGARERLARLLKVHWITLEENKKGMLVTLRLEATGHPEISVMTFDHENVGVAVERFNLTE